MPVTPAQLAEWRLALREEGDGEFLDPTLARQIAPKLMEELERAWARAEWADRDAAVKEAAALVSVSTLSDGVVSELSEGIPVPTSRVL